jgi:hypothetical protein
MKRRDLLKGALGLLGLGRASKTTARDYTQPVRHLELGAPWPKSGFFKTDRTPWGVAPGTFCRLIWPDRVTHLSDFLAMPGSKTIRTWYPDEDPTDKLAKYILWFFCTRAPCRIVVASAHHNELVLGYIRQLLGSASRKLPVDEVNGLLIRPKSMGLLHDAIYFVPVKWTTGGLLGHHVARQQNDWLPRSLFVGIGEEVSPESNAWERAETWAHETVWMDLAAISIDWKRKRP